MIRIAVTGGIACGKSMVSEYLAADGVLICETDLLARRLMKSGMPVYSSVIREFGSEILDGSGEVDRGRLGRVVFGDPARLAKLNSIVHPGVIREWNAWLADREADGARECAVVVPLLFECGCGSGWDATICVASCFALQMERLIARGLGEDEARSRIVAQMPLSGKMVLCDYVVVNNGDHQSLRDQVMMILEEIRRRTE